MTTIHTTTPLEFPEVSHTTSSSCSAEAHQHEYQLATLTHKDRRRIPEHAVSSPSSTKQRLQTHTNIIHVQHPKSILPHLPQNLPQENDEGYREYKLKLLNLESKRIKHLVTQMKFRIMEGGGEAIYEIGVADDGTPEGLDEHEMRETLDNIRHMARQLKAECTVLAERIIHASPRRRVIEMSVKQKALETYLELNTIFVAACFVVEGEETEDADDDLDFGFGTSDDSAEDDDYFENEFACSMENLGLCMGMSAVTQQQVDESNAATELETTLEVVENVAQDEEENFLHLEWLFAANVNTSVSTIH